jgi:hypothetical protein
LVQAVAEEGYYLALVGQQAVVAVPVVERTMQDLVVAAEVGVLQVVPTDLAQEELVVKQ